MKSKLCHFGVISVLIFLMCFGMIFMFISNIGNQMERGIMNDYRLDRTASPDKNNPVILLKDLSIYETLPNLTVYYRTLAASNLYFHVVWVRCTSGHNPLIGLYQESTYSTLLAQMTHWLIVKPDVSLPLNVAIDPDTMENPTAYVAWEEALVKLTSGSSVSGTLSDANYVDAYEVHLDPSGLYNFRLSVPAGADLDLWVYPTNYSFSGFTFSDMPDVNSTTNGLSLDENINSWSPSMSGVHIVLISCANGSGTYSLTFECTNCPIPINSAMIFIGIIVGVLIYKQKSKKITFELPHRQFEL